MRLRDIARAKDRLLRTLLAECPLSDALALMDRHAIGSVVVVDAASQVRGIVSQPEILSAFRAFGRRAFDCPVGDIMRCTNLKVDGEASDEDALAMMTSHRVRHLLVMDGNTSCLGIVSLGDLVAARLAEVQLESRVLRDMARAAVVGRPG